MRVATDTHVQKEALFARYIRVTFPFILFSRKYTAHLHYIVRDAAHCGKRSCWVKFIQDLDDKLLVIQF